MSDLDTNGLLVIGIGNSGRRDDGLGWRFLDLLKEMPGFQGHIEYRYQLQIEDAELISHFDRVLFVDACKDDHQTGFTFNPLQKKYSSSFTSHAVPPAHILSLCSDLYDKNPKAYMLAISGYEWQLRLGLCDQAKNNLTKAFKFLKQKMAKTERLNPSNVEF